MSKTALITGASSGIGLSLLTLMTERSINVTGLARNFNDAELNASVTPVKLDLSKVDELPEKLSSDVKLNKAFDILILNAGYGRFGGLEQFSHEQIRHLVDTNLLSNLFLLKHFLPKMKQRGGGDIVIIGSESALQGAKAGAVYCATKFALRGLAQSLRADCSTSNIRVILVNPGPVDSGFFEELNFAPQEGDEFVIDSMDVANTVLHALQQPRNVVCDEINMQPIKRSFQKKR